MGAFTPWHDRRSHATQDIVVGAELFVDYGYNYFEGSRESIFGLVPFLTNFKIADKLLSQFTNITQKLLRTKWKTCLISKLTMSDRQEQCRFDYLKKTEKPLQTDMYALTKLILGLWPSRTLAALPDTPESISTLQHEGGTAKKDYARSIRDIHYLQNHGTCLDHLMVQSSTIIEAGRGAFATRYLPKDSIVAPVPLIHLPNRNVLHMYDTKINSFGRIKRDISKPPIHQQLLLNYCFGHDESTLLLCPYGIVSSLINHAPLNINNGVSANVKIVWSNKTMSHPEWRDLPLSDWAYTYQTGLAFDYIAIRDIEEGEEVFVDYGDAWQMAWDEHVVNYTPVTRLIDTLNADIDSIVPTRHEWNWVNGDVNVDSQAVNLWCYNIYREMQGLPLASESDAYRCTIILRQDI